MIRGANPQPGAWSTHNGEPVQIFDCRIKTDVDGSPGDVVEVSEDSFTIAANGGGIVVQRVRSGKDKLAANEYAEQAGIQSGAKFG